MSSWWSSISIRTNPARRPSRLDLSALGLDWEQSLTVRDELTGETYHWGQDNYVRLDPAHAAGPHAHV